MPCMPWAGLTADNLIHVPMIHRYSLLLLTLMAFPLLCAQRPVAPPRTIQDPPLCLTAEEDHQRMMDLLGITRLRSGKGPDASQPNGANYEESLANPYPELPDPLKMDNGKKVTTAGMWWEQRRPEILEHFEREIYGRLPEDLPEVRWELEFQEREMIGWTPVTVKKLTGHVDNSAYPFIDVRISMVVVTPQGADGPVPLLMMFGPAAVPAPAQPDQAEFRVLNDALLALLARDTALKSILDKYPAYQPLVRPEGVNQWGWHSPASIRDSRIADLIQSGWGYAMIDPASIQADNGAGLTCSGIIALANRGKARKPDDWGALRAWGWGASRGLDYLETDPDVNPGMVGIEGVSRYGKAALVTMAFDTRFAFGLIGSSGKGGVTLHRRSFGEAVENLAGRGEYHWMAGNYLKYAAAEGRTGEMNASMLPVDSHELIALCAPRLVFISYGIPEEGDAHWLDHRGSYMAAVAAQPVYRLLGAKGLGVPDDYMHAQMPDPTVGLLDGHLAWRQHTGGHTDAPNITYFVKWVPSQINRNGSQ